VRAAAALEAGEVVGIPTDTVYGLSADPRRKEAVDRIFDLKGRPRGLELPVLVADLEQAEALADGGLPPPARLVADRFWPGAVTIVVRRRPDIDWDLGGQRSTIGIRCPAHPVPRWLCERIGPLATTSANFHGEAPFADAVSMRSAFGDRLALVLDGGPSTGPPSTVIDLSQGAIRCLREGGVNMADIEAAASS